MTPKLELSINMRVRTKQKPIRTALVKYTHANGCWVQFDDNGQKKFYDYYEWDEELEELVDHTITEWLDTLK